MLQRMADSLRRSILYSDIAFAGCILLRDEGMLAARYLGRNDFADSLSGMIRVGKNNYTPALHGQLDLGNDPAIHCRTPVSIVSASTARLTATVSLFPSTTISSLIINIFTPYSRTQKEEDSLPSFG